MRHIRAHPAISHFSHLLLKMQSGYKYKSLAKSAVLVVQKLHLLISFGFFNIAFIIPSHFIIVQYFTLWMLDFFNTIRVSNSLDPD